MPKYSQRYFKPEGFKLKDNWYVGFEWTVPGSKAGTDYTVTLTEKGFTCECTGFGFHGKCKHSRKVVENFD